MSLTLRLTGTAQILQGQQTTLTAQVTDDDGNTLSGITYAWTASRGAFVGDTDGASVVYHADFTDDSDVDVTISCAVTADSVPEISEPSLTAMTELTIAGQVLNILVTSAGAPIAGQNSILWSATESIGAIDANSDRDISPDINVYRARWNTTGSGNPRFILNATANGPIGDYFRNNADKSVFLIFDDGSYYEVTHATVNPGAQPHHLSWNVMDSNAIAKLNALGETTPLLIGVGDAGSIGTRKTASENLTVTARVVPLTIEPIDEQFIILGTKDYVLIVDIGGNPDSVDPKGHMEGFFSDWDAVNGQLRIKADAVTRLISGVTWDIELRKGMRSLLSQIKYNVIPAGPILETLPTIHFYRGVPLNLDIIIANLPPLLIPNARLVGLKSELREYGVNISGEIPMDAIFSFNQGNATIIIPDETGETSEMHDYPYVIESGTPPALGTPEFTPHGNFGVLEFDDVTNALGYEWTLDPADAAAPSWRFFNSTRNVINPSEIAVSPGNLNVTIKFPNVPGASQYAYSLDSEAHDREWTAFAGTLENGMITTIIPDLQDGVEYTLRLRVASPWVGTPVSITVYGGRLAYCTHNDRDENSQLYIFHTGVPRGGVATTIKRMFLPTGCEYPDGLVVVGTTAYCLTWSGGRNSERGIHVFSTEIADGARATRIKRIHLPYHLENSAPSLAVRTMGFYNDELYLFQRHEFDGEQYDIFTVSINEADGATATPIAHWDPNLPSPWGNNAQRVGGIYVDADRIYLEGNDPPYDDLAIYERESLTPTVVPILAQTILPVPHEHPKGLVVIGSRVYSVDSQDNRLYIFDIAASAQPLESILSYFTLPPGLNNVSSLYIPVD